MQKQYLPIFASFMKLTPSTPAATSENPMMPPTILWVPETGNLKTVAISCQTVDPVLTYQ